MAQIPLDGYITDEFLPNDLVDTLLFKFLEAKKIDPVGAHPSVCSTVNGWHSAVNLLEEPGFKDIADKIISLFPGGNETFKCSFLQFVEYYDGGWCKEHDHSRTEFYSFIVYLNTTVANGKTVFFIDEKAAVAHRPVKGKVVFFPGKLRHLAEPTTGNKIVFVGALQLK